MHGAPGKFSESFHPLWTDSQTNLGYLCRLFLPYPYNTIRNPGSQAKLAEILYTNWEGAHLCHALICKALPSVWQRFKSVKSITWLLNSVDIRSQEKDEKDQKMVSRLPGFIYLLWMNGISLVQRTFTYHGNLIGKSRITYHNLRITLWSPVPRHAANLVSFTDHVGNFEITRDVKNFCHPPSWQ